METRVLRTDFWEDDKIVGLNLDTRLLYLCLLTNPKIGQLRIYKLSDRQISFYCGLSLDQLFKCKSDLESSELAFFFEGYICITGRAYVESTYSGTKNSIAKQKTINEIDESVLVYFNAILDRVSIPYRYHRDTAINNKSKSNKEEPVDKVTTLGVEYKKASDVWQEIEGESNAVSFKR